MNSIALIYIAGPYRPANGRSIDENAQDAEAAACDLIRSGAPALPIVPHSIGLRYSYLSPAGGDEGYWLPATLALMERCHAVLMLPGWRMSSGATGERARAIEIGLPVFESVEEVAAWAATRAVAQAAPPDAAPSVPAPPSASQVAEVLRRAARGEVPVACRGDRRWTDRSGFTVPVVVDGWVLDIHNDCGGADYMAQATSPAGAVADYNALCAGRGPLYLGPLEDLSEDDLDALERVLEAAPLEAP